MSQQANEAHNGYMKSYRNGDYKDVMARRYRKAIAHGVPSIQAAKMRSWSDERIEKYLIDNNYKK